MTVLEAVDLTKTFVGGDGGLLTVLKVGILKGHSVHVGWGITVVAARSRGS